MNVLESVKSLTISGICYCGTDVGLIGILKPLYALQYYLTALELFEILQKPFLLKIYS